MTRFNALHDGGSMRASGRDGFQTGNDHTLIWQITVALLCTVAAFGLRLLLDPILFGVPFITFFPAVALAAYGGGTKAGMITAISGGLLASYFWIPPLRQFAISASAISTVMIYFFLAGLILFLIHRLNNALQRAQEAEFQSELYARETAHRVANLIALVQAVSSMTFKNDEATVEQRKLFNSRLSALGHALSAPLSRDGAQDLGLLLRSVLEPFGERIAIDAPPVRISASAASSLALIFHELATNAVKYGALSNADGHVDRVERGGPPVARSPTRRGFGTRLLQKSMRPELGVVEVEFDPDGLKSRIFLKQDHRASSERAGGMTG
jgi:two-component sensor histidine kinase